MCKDMQEMLNKCTQHTEDGHDSIRDWLKMQFQGRSFADMKRLASYKSTLSIAFASINMYRTIHHLLVHRIRC